MYDDYASGMSYDLMTESSYRLLAWYASQFQDVSLINIGTQTGLSAYALAYNPKNTVYTFDKISSQDQVIHPTIKNRSNICFHKAIPREHSFQREDIVLPREDVILEYSSQSWIEILLKTPLIFLDLDSHEGTHEWAFYQFLKQIGYRGLLLCNGIWAFKGIRDHFWSQIPIEQRYDLTHLGHQSGTGLISFGASIIINHPQIGINN